MTDPQNTDTPISDGSKSADARARQLSGLRPFQPGQSGNPSGRPAVAKAVREALRNYIVDGGGLEKLLALANGNSRDQRAALQMIFEFALGKPATVIAGADSDEMRNPLEIIISRPPSTSYTSTEAPPEAS